MKISRSDRNYVKTPTAAKMANRSESYMCRLRLRGEGPPTYVIDGVLHYELRSLRAWVHRRDRKLREQQRRRDEAAEREREQLQAHRAARDAERKQREKERVAPRHCRYCKILRPADYFASLYQCKQCKRDRAGLSPKGASHHGHSEPYASRLVEAETVEGMRDWERRRQEQVKRDHEALKAITDEYRPVRKSTQVEARRISASPGME